MVGQSQATGRSPVAGRILDAASQLFYAEGARAVSADRVIADAGVSKVTFYRHYRTKDALVVAYLTELAAAERAAFDALRAAHPGDPAGTLRAYAEGVGQQSCASGFRGCPFINAAAEYPLPDHPVRAVVDQRRSWLLGATATLVGELGVESPEDVAEELLMLRDGAMVAGYVGRPEVVAAALLRAGTAIVADRRVRATA